MTWDRVSIVEQRLDSHLTIEEPDRPRLAAHAPLHDGTSLDAATALGIFEDQLASRQIDVASRELKKTNRSYYTIGSAGHENNAVVGARLRIDDPGFLHYRSGGFMMARARQLAGSTPTLDTLLGVVASSEDPIAQGRHKVWGSRALWVPPQTSTIASHLPKAVGLAFSLARAKRLGVASGARRGRDRAVLVRRREREPRDRAGRDQHGALRRAHGPADADPVRVRGQRHRHQRADARRLDRGHLRRARRTCATSHAEGELDEVWDAVGEAVEHVRQTRQPAFLHLRTVRLWGHAGSDAEQTYRAWPRSRRSRRAIRSLRNARRLVETGAATPEELRDLVRETRERVARRGRGGRPASPPPDDRGGHRAAGAIPSRAGASAATTPRASRRRARRRRSDATLPEAARPRRPRGPWQAASTRRWPTSCCGAPSSSSSARTSGARAASTTSRTGCRSASARPCLRHAARRDEHPRHRAGRGADRPAAGARDPVPRLPPQRPRPAARRGGLAPVLHSRPVPQPDGRARRRASPTRRASAGTSTTTTASARCATSPASCSPRRRAATTPPACCAGPWRWRRRTGAWSSSSSRSRSTTRRTSTPTATAAG